MTLKEWAHRYAQNGWSIFPLAPKSKEPHHRLLGDTGFVRDGKATWKPLMELKAPKELIEEWWTMDPNANIGLVCGRISNVIVVDIDYKPESDPYFGWIQPREIASKLCDLTMTGISGSGVGLHLFCKYQSGIPCSIGKFQKQIDIKSDGGYIVLPPSIHDKTGNEYCFDPMFPYSENNLKNFANFPELLVDKIKEHKDKKNSKEDWIYILNGLREKIDGRDGGGTELIGKFVHILWMGFNADPVFLPFLWDVFKMWNQKNKPPMEEEQLKKIFKSIVSKYL